MNNMTQLFHADRENLIRYIDGELISMKNGEGFIVNELEANKALSELKAGREIILMTNGIPVSKVVSVNDSYTEMEFYEDNNI